MPALHHVFSTAAFHHQAGNLRQAEAYCLRVLKKDATHADSLQLLGVIASDSGNHEMGAMWIARAIDAAGPVPGYCVNLGLVMSRQGRPEAAISCFRQALRSNPYDAKTLVQLGKTLVSVGLRKDALTAFETAIDVDGGAEAHFELANLYHVEGEFDRAVTHFQAAIRVQPCYPESHFNLGVTLTRQNRVDEAMTAYSHALVLRPGYAQAWNNQGVLLHALGRFADAEEHYARSLQMRPDYTDPHYNLGLLLQDRDRLEESLLSYDNLLILNPQHAEGHNNRANVLLALGKPLDAASGYHRAIQYQPGYTEAHLNLSLTHLLTGRFREGWQEFEWRLLQKDSKDRPQAQPVWSGEAAPDARVLLYSEQGFGDTVQFARFAKLVRSLCGFVIVECELPLVRLLESVPGIDQVVARGTPLPYFDFQAPLLSLPRILGLEAIPASGSYITARRSLVKRWSNRIPQDASLRVGLVWAGNPKHKNDRNRSIQFEELRPLLGLDGITFYALQKDSNVEATKCLGSDLIDFADTAAAIANLDLVITVDTSVAHLAGAMGKAVWVLLPFAPDWRWMLDREDSCWYPSMRLFRQAERKNWSQVIEKVQAELLSWATRA